MLGRDVWVLAARAHARRTVIGTNGGDSVSDAYLTPEDRARRSIDAQLETAGWLVQSRDEVNVSAGLGVAIRDRRGMPDPDYLLFIDTAVPDRRSAFRSRAGGPVLGGPGSLARVVVTGERIPRFGGRGGT